MHPHQIHHSTTLHDAFRTSFFVDHQTSYFQNLYVHSRWYLPENVQFQSYDHSLSKQNLVVLHHQSYILSVYDCFGERHPTHFSLMISFHQTHTFTCLYSPSCLIKLSALSIAAFVSESSVLI